MINHWKDFKILKCFWSLAKEFYRGYKVFSGAK